MTDASGSVSDVSTVMHVLPDLAIGGGQMVVLRHAHALATRGRRSIVVYCKTTATMAPSFAQAGIPSHGLGHRGLRDAARTARRVLEIARRERVDIVHTHGTPHDKFLGHLTTALRALPQVTTLHGQPPSAWSAGAPSVRARARGAAQRVMFAADWWLARRTVDRVVAVSDSVLEAWRPMLRAVGLAESAQVIRSGLPLEAFARVHPARVAAVREALLDGRPGPVVIAVSRLSRGKNVALLVDVMARVARTHPGVVLRIVGDGPERADLETRIRATGLGGCIELVGERSDVPLLLQASDVLVFPSQNEGFGLVALEALASGTPVVSFDLPSLRDVARDTQALRMARAGTADAFAAELLALLADPRRLAALGEQGRRAVEASWGIDVSARAYEAVYAAVRCGR